MANTLFINTEDVKKRSPMGGNVDSDKYIQSIYHVQQTQLKPIIGDDLYEAIKVAIDDYDDGNGTPIPARIDALLSGSMRDFIVMYAVSDYALLSNYTMDNGGTTTYLPTNGNAVSTDEIIRLTERLEDKGKFYGQQLIAYLKDNKSTYPEWKGSKTSSNFFGWVMDDYNDCL